MKLKHAAGNKTDREKLAVSFIYKIFHSKFCFQKTLVVQYNSKKSLPSELSINLPPGLLEEASKDYNINMTKAQLKELQKDAEASFNEYLSKCQKLGMIDPSTGMPLSQGD